MGVDLIWEDANRKPLEEVPDPRLHLSTILLTASGVSHTACLQFIDPYGNTTFNQRQIPILIRELDAVLQRTTDEDVRIHLLRVIELAERSRGKGHTYLRFAGE